MFGFSTMQVAGAALIAAVGVVYAVQNRASLLGALGLGGGGSIVPSSSRGNGLGENDLKKADGLCFDLGAIARKSNDAAQRKAILDAVHTIEGALTLEPAKTAAASRPSWTAGGEGDPQQQQQRAG